MKSFLSLVHPTDAERGWAYDCDSNMGRLDKDPVEACVKDWTVVDMKCDWRVIYPNALKQVPMGALDFQLTIVCNRRITEA